MILEDEDYKRLQELIFCNLKHQEVVSIILKKPMEFVLEK